MSGETESQVSGWTVDTLHQHFQVQIDDIRQMLDERATNAQRAIDREFEAHRVLTNTQINDAEKAVSTALASAEKAVSKAEAATEKRFEAVNEFRAQLADQAALFLPRTEYAANHQNLADRVTDLTDRINRNEGKSAGTAATMGALLAVATIVISVVVIFVNVLLR